MHVNIDEIKEAGLERSWELSRDAVDELIAGEPAGYRATGPLHVEARFRRVQERVLLEASAGAKVSAPCGRCLAEVDVDLPVEFELTFVPVRREDGAGATRGRGGEVEGEARHREEEGNVAGSFDAGTVDEEGYTGKVLELDPVVREQVLLALPAYPVCRPDCQGLCPVCGGNRNERACGCDPHVPDPRWAALEKLKGRT